MTNIFLRNTETVFQEPVVPLFNEISSKRPKRGQLVPEILYFVFLNKKTLSQKRDDSLQPVHVFIIEWSVVILLSCKIIAHLLSALNIYSTKYNVSTPKHKLSYILSANQKQLHVLTFIKLLLNLSTRNVCMIILNQFFRARVLIHFQINR